MGTKVVGSEIRTKLLVNEQYYIISVLVFYLARSGQETDTTKSIIARIEPASASTWIILHTCAVSFNIFMILEL